jgi:hypothetical protein
MTSQLLADLSVVRGHRILFLHHSVGRNVLAGIEQIDREVGEGRLAIVPPEAALETGSPALVDATGGQNQDPESKMAAFAEMLRREPRLKPDLAFMKLCYVDFHPRTDVGRLFSSYERTIAEVRRDHPELRVAHVTAPLRRRPAGLKSLVRRLLGRGAWEDAANTRRYEFNERLLATYPADPIFDLARIEATAPDGTVTTFQHGSRQIPSLYPGYTDDGGHLNAMGQRVAGEQAIRFLALSLQGL